MHERSGIVQNMLILAQISLISCCYEIWVIIALIPIAYRGVNSDIGGGLRGFYIVIN